MKGGRERARGACIYRRDGMRVMGGEKREHVWGSCECGVWAINVGGRAVRTKEQQRTDTGVVSTSGSF